MPSHSLKLWRRYTLHPKPYTLSDCSCDEEQTYCAWPACEYLNRKLRMMNLRWPLLWNFVGLKMKSAFLRKFMIRICNDCMLGCMNNGQSFTPICWSICSFGVMLTCHSQIVSRDWQTQATRVVLYYCSNETRLWVRRQIHLIDTMKGNRVDNTLPWFDGCRMMLIGQAPCLLQNLGKRCTHNVFKSKNMSSKFYSTNGFFLLHYNVMIYQQLTF